MKIIFCGTPDYAVSSLRRILRLEPLHQVVAVVSQPDKPKGRSRTPSPPPVVAAARDMGMTPDCIFQPRSINQREILDALGALAPDLLCVVAYGKILKEEALHLARLFPINAHASLLPRYRGAAPIQAALLAGESETGVSIIKMEADLDSGPVMLRRSLQINAADDAGSLHDKLADLSADCFEEAIHAIEAENFLFTAQDESLATYAPKLTKESGCIDWLKDADFLERFVRAMNPWPGAWTTIALKDGSHKQRVRVAGAGLDGAPASNAEAGLARVSVDDVMKVACGGGGSLTILRIQPEGKRMLNMAEYLRGAGRIYVPEARLGV